MSALNVNPRQTQCTFPYFQTGASLAPPSTREFLFQRSQYDASEYETILPTPSPISHLLLTQISDPHYRLLRKTLLNMETGEGGELVVFESQLNIYGVGETEEEAVGDFVSMLVDLFKELIDSEDILSHHLHQQLKTIRAILAPR